MQTSTFVQSYYQNPKDKPLLKRVGGILPVSKNVFNEEITDLKVDNVTHAINIQKIAQHLGLELEDVTHDAVEICGMKQEAKVFEKKVQDFDHREHQFANGSIVEKMRRFVGSNPIDPRSQVPREQQAPVINITLPEGLAGGDASLSARLEAQETNTKALDAKVSSLLEILEAQFKTAQAEGAAQTPAPEVVEAK